MLSKIRQILSRSTNKVVRYYNPNTRKLDVHPAPGEIYEHKLLSNERWDILTKRVVKESRQQKFFQRLKALGAASLATFTAFTLAFPSISLNGFSHIQRFSRETSEKLDNFIDPPTAFEKCPTIIGSNIPQITKHSLRIERNAKINEYRIKGPVEMTVGQTKFTFEVNKTVSEFTSENAVNQLLLDLQRIAENGSKPILNAALCVNAFSSQGSLKNQSSITSIVDEFKLRIGSEILSVNGLNLKQVDNSGWLPLGDSFGQDLQKSRDEMANAICQGYKSSAALNGGLSYLGPSSSSQYLRFSVAPRLTEAGCEEDLKQTFLNPLLALMAVDAAQSKDNFRAKYLNGEGNDYPKAGFYDLKSGITYWVKPTRFTQRQLRDLSKMNGEVFIQQNNGLGDTSLPFSSQATSEALSILGVSNN
ncbi:MAG: hypothetical protein SFU25_09520 [Candidatus Caenarcaniphilales bacterium]|nr:hypothetical protein [Candidatus Caenarcaniphilales bacterium]